MIFFLLSLIHVEFCQNSCMYHFMLLISFCLTGWVLSWNVGSSKSFERVEFWSVRHKCGWRLNMFALPRYRIMTFIVTKEFWQSVASLAVTPLWTAELGILSFKGLPKIFHVKFDSWNSASEFRKHTVSWKLCMNVTLRIMSRLPFS